MTAPLAPNPGETGTLLSLVPARIRRIVARYVGPAPGACRLDDDTPLEALRLDSHHRQAIACELDEAFAVTVPDDDVAEWSTLGDLARTIARLKGFPA